MAQLRQDYQQFRERNAVILVVGPDDQEAFQDYWEKNDLPFTGLPDPEHTVLNLYQQQVKLLRFGRMPAMAIIDKNSIIRYKHYGDTMRDIVSNQHALAVLDLVNQENSVG
jgi:peroxiredoxin Q/BCP